MQHTHPDLKYSLMKFEKDSVFGSYDERHDILYIYYKGKDYSYGSEISDSIVIMRSLKTDQINGYIIYDFKHKVRNEVIDYNQFDLVFRVALKELTEEIPGAKIS